MNAHPKDHDLVYVATVYTKHPDGIEQAYKDACAITARLTLEGYKPYSPIAHTHGIAVHGRLDPLDHNLWLPFDEAMMQKSDALVVIMMDGWQDSRGIRYEIGYFKGQGKPIYYLCPDSLTVMRNDALQPRRSS